MSRSVKAQGPYSLTSERLARNLSSWLQWAVVNLNAFIHRWCPRLVGRQTAIRSVSTRRALTVTALCIQCSSLFLIGCRSTDPQTTVESTADQAKAEVQPSAEASARVEEQTPPADLRGYHGGPISPEGYRLLEEKDRREPPQGHASVPDLPAEEKQRVEQTLATMKAFSGKLERVHSLDYCRAAKETAPMDAWGSELTAFCTHKGMGLTLSSAGPDRIKKSKDDVRWGFSIPLPKMDDSWTNSSGTF